MNHPRRIRPRASSRRRAQRISRFASAAQRADQRRDLLVIQRSRDRLDGLHAHRASHRTLATGALHERPVAIRHALARPVRALLDRVLALKPPGQHRVLIERRDIVDCAAELS
jgi:hypothetical protein